MDIFRFIIIYKNIADKVNAIYSATYGQVKEKIDNIENNVDDIGNKYIENIYVGEDGKLHKVQGGADSVLPFSKSDGIILNELTLNSNAWGSAYEYGGSATSKTDSNIIINTNGAKLLSCTSISGTGKVYVHRLQENGTEIGSTQILNSGGIVDISSAFKILISAQTSVTCSWSRGSQGSNPSSSASITIKITNLKLS